MAEQTERGLLIYLLGLRNVSFETISNVQRPRRLGVALKLPSRPFTPETVTNLFARSLNHREEFRLYSNGVNEGIPAQYRFLSFYKLLEMQCRRKGKWNNTKLRELIQSRLVDGTQLVPLEIPAGEHPLAAFAGMFRDDPLFEEWQQAIAEYRQQAEEDPHRS